MKKGIIDQLCAHINAARGLKYPEKGYMQYSNIAGDGRSHRTVYVVTGDSGGLTACHNGATPNETARNLRFILSNLKEKQAMETEFEQHAARAFFASAWADACDEEGPGVPSGAEIMDIMPDEVDPAAMHAARTLRFDIERANGCSVSVLLARIRANSEHGYRPKTMEYFGHYAAMQAMGHGVGLDDAFGSDVYDSIKIPYVEFGSHSLERDYF